MTQVKEEQKQIETELEPKPAEEILSKLLHFEKVE